MPRQFDGTSDYIAMDIGTCGTNTGALTWAFVIKKENDADLRGIAYLAGVGSEYAAAAGWGGATSRQQWLLDGFGTGSFADYTNGLTIADGWGILVYRKAAGAVGARNSQYIFSNTTWTHGVIGGALAVDAVVNSNVVFGTPGPAFGGANDFIGHLDIAAFWTSELTDPQILTLTSLSAWTTLSPNALWRFDQLDINTQVPDLTGHGANEVGHNGTAVSGETSPFVVTTPGSSVPPHPVRRRQRLLAR